MAGAEMNQAQAEDATMSTTKGAGRHHQRGLTLIEIMVVVAVLAILSAIAYPTYTDQVRKSRRTDARAALQQVALAQERYYTVNGVYTDDLTNLNLPAFLQSGDSRQGMYALSLNVPAGNRVFTVTASPVSGKGQDKDADCTSLLLDQAGIQNATGGDTDHCW